MGGRDLSPGTPPPSRPSAHLSNESVTGVRRCIQGRSNRAGVASKFPAGLFAWPFHPRDRGLLPAEFPRCNHGPKPLLFRRLILLEGPAGGRDRRGFATRN